MIAALFPWDHVFRSLLATTPRMAIARCPCVARLRLASPRQRKGRGGERERKGGLVIPHTLLEILRADAASERFLGSAGRGGGRGRRWRDRHRAVVSGSASAGWRRRRRCRQRRRRRRPGKTAIRVLVIRGGSGGHGEVGAIAEARAGRRLHYDIHNSQGARKASRMLPAGWQRADRKTTKGGWLLRDRECLDLRRPKEYWWEVSESLCCAVSCGSGGINGDGRTCAKEGGDTTPEVRCTTPHLPFSNRRAACVSSLWRPGEAGGRRRGGSARWGKVATVDTANPIEAGGGEPRLLVFGTARRDRG